MFHLHRIESLDLPELAPYRTLKRPRDHSDQGIFVPERENLGVLVRNCVAFGAQALLVGETSSSPFLRRAVRNSMGTIFQLPVVEPPILTRSLKDLRQHSMRCIATHPHAES